MARRPVDDLNRTPMSHPSPTFRAAVDLARPSAVDLCAALNIPAGTLNAYHAGTRRTPPHVATALALYLRHHARELKAMADTLEAVAAAAEPALAGAGE